MTMVDIRELEEQTKRELDEERAKVNFFLSRPQLGQISSTDSADLIYRLGYSVADPH